MKTVKISISGNEYKILRAMSKACSKDISRLSLTGVYYDAELKKIVATDGHILRTEPVDLCLVDENNIEIPVESFIIDPSFWLLSDSNWCKVNNIPKNMMDTKIIVEAKIMDEEYPDYRVVIPAESTTNYHLKEPLIELHLDPKKLSRFLDTIVNDDVIISFLPCISFRGAVLVFSTNRFLGLIMPVLRINAAIMLPEIIENEPLIRKDCPESV
jgi:hypothetical protein